MSTDSTVRKATKALQLRPSAELRRPDEHGQLPHIFLTTYPDRSISELDVDDILEVNWQAVETAIEDSIIRVRHEGDLSSATVRETIQLVALALKKLEIDDAGLQRQLATRLDIGFWAWFVSLLPTESGMKLRLLVKDRKEAKGKRKALKKSRDAIFELRVELADEVDAKIDLMLRATDAEYRDLHQKASKFAPIIATAKAILADLEELDEVEQSLADCSDGAYSSVRQDRSRERQLEGKIPAFERFCAQHTEEIIVNRGDIEIFVRQLLADYESRTEPFDGQMAGKRDAVKQKLYGEARALLEDEMPAQS